MFLIDLQDKRLTSVRGKKYLQVAKNRYSGELGIVPLDFDKDALSYQAKKKSKSKTDEPDKLLNQCSVDDANYIDDYEEKKTREDFSIKSQNIHHKNQPSSYLSDVLNSRR